MIHDLFVYCLYIIVEDVEDTRTILYLCVFLLNHSHVGKNRLVERKLFTVQNPMPDTNREKANNKLECRIFTQFTIT